MKQILLVDDDADLLEALTRQFHPYRHEWRVATAVNGVEALRLAREQSLDLLITDILMPRMDGIEVVLAFRRDYPRVKIVVMSGGGRHVGKEPLKYARMFGAHAAIEKPFDFLVMRDTIRSLLEPEPNITSSLKGIDS